MERYSRNEEVRPQLLDLIPKEREEWVVKRDELVRSDEEKKVELRLGLGPPGDQDWAIKVDGSAKNNSLLSLGYFSKMGHNNHGSQAHKFSSGHQQQQQNQSSFLQFQTASQSLPVTKEPSQACCTKVVGLGELQNAEKKAFSPASANTAVPNSSQKRTAPASVVGWPPIRSFRKNLASGSSAKPPPEVQDVVPNKVSSEKQVENCHKGLFVKINMDGVPIGRKVDLKAYDSYEKLSSAVDELFRGLLAAQMDSSAGGIQIKQEGEKAIMGLLDGSGEYTLVYEDNEGDRMLVGDVPWHMFVSSVKRLRVLKSSELSTLFLGSKQEKNPLHAAALK